MLGFFSFTEVLDPAAHHAYNAWHQLDHLPEQFSIEGVRFGQRWVCTPACQEARFNVSPLLQSCQYMTLYLMRDAAVLPDFYALARRLREEDRFFSARHSHLSGPYEVTGRWAAPRVKVGAAVVPFRPARGVYVVVGPRVEAPDLVTHRGVAGAWQFADDSLDRHITVAFVDGDLVSVAAELGQWCLRAGVTGDWAGPLEAIDPYRWEWFAKFAPQ